MPPRLFSEALSSALFGLCHCGSAAMCATRANPRHSGTLQHGSLLIRHFGSYRAARRRLCASPPHHPPLSGSPVFRWRSLHLGPVAPAPSVPLALRHSVAAWFLAALCCPRGFRYRSDARQTSVPRRLLLAQGCLRSAARATSGLVWRSVCLLLLSQPSLFLPPRVRHGSAALSYPAATILWVLRGRLPTFRRHRCQMPPP